MMSALIALAFGTDVCLRRLPIRTVAFRQWEVAEFAPTALGPWVPGLRYRNPKSYGDLSNFANLPQYRVSRTDVFTSDADGFRNTPGATGQVRIVVAGDSFMAGGSLSDSETLSAQLSALTGVAAYNAAPKVTWQVLDQVLARHQVRNGLVVLGISEGRITSNLFLDSSETWIDSAMRRVAPSFQKELRTTEIRTTAWLEYSPLRVFLSRAFRSIENDKYLPNPGAALVGPMELTNGHRMLFYTNAPKSVFFANESDAGYFVRVRERVRQTGNELLVVMIPGRYRVYRPLMKSGGLLDSAYARLIPALDRAGVPAIDLTPLMSTQAAELLPQGKYNFQDDDTHWNRLGVHCAAEAIAARWKQMSQP
jgi:hypothetical protein